MQRRSIELILLCVATPAMWLLFGMLYLNLGVAPSFETILIPAGLMLAFGATHIATRFLAPNADPVIMPITYVLAGIGLAFITRIAPYSAVTTMATTQLMWLFLGALALIVVLAVVRNIEKLANYKYTFMLLGMIFLLSPLLPFIGTEIYGSRIWLSIAGYSFQPGEIAKILIVIFLAGYLSANRELLSVFTWKLGPFKLPDARIILPVLIMWMISLVIVIFEKDLGSALIFFSVFVVMVYVATGKKTYLITGAILIVIGAIAASLLFDHVSARVNIWIDPWVDASGSGYQIVQSIYAIANGDLFGAGIGKGLAGGSASGFILPVAESDFIFSVIAEETGLLGAAGVLLLFLSFSIRGIVIAARAKSDVSALLSVGLTTIIVIQAFIIVGGVTKLIPLTGITLPFVSQGGSSLLSGFIILALLLRAGDSATGIGEEIQTGMTGRFADVSAVQNDSVLGRIALGKRLTNLMRIFALLFAILVINMTLIMVVSASHYQNMPGNNHTMMLESKTKRGSISTSDGVILAQSSVNEEGYYTREYPQGDLATHVIGYYSQKYGNTGIEQTYNDVLKGDSNFASFADAINRAAGINQSGNDIKLTINSEIQTAAQKALEGYAGAVIVSDPTTGAILAMASSPTYNTAEFQDVLDSNANAQTNEGSSALNRATQVLYAPGSTFKSMTLATALETGTASPASIYSSPSSIEIGGSSVTNYDSTDYGDISLERATEVSSNTVFGEVGVEIGAEKLVKAAQEYGFDKLFDFELPTIESVMADPKEMSEWETAWAAVGQPVLSGGDYQESLPGPQASVLQMLLVANAFANDGIINTPYLVESTYNSQGIVSASAKTKELYKPVSKEIAQQVSDVLVGVVQNGTGAAAQIAGAEIAGKTGTAETGKPADDSWFIGYNTGAKTGKPNMSIAIVLEQAPQGASTPLARDIMSEALRVLGAI